LGTVSLRGDAAGAEEGSRKEEIGGRMGTVKCRTDRVFFNSG